MGLVLQVLTPQIKAYNSYTLGNNSKLAQTTHTIIEVAAFWLKPVIFAQASPSASLKLTYLA